MYKRQAKGERRTVLDYGKVGDTVSWRYPDEQISVSLSPEKDYLSVEITSENENDNSFTWPVISADTYYFPFGEGKRVPADDPAWFDYLNGQEFQVMEQLSMPFWISSAGSYNLLFVMEDPYRTEMNFTSDSPIAFSVSHQYPAIDDNRTNKFRIYITDKDPVSAAKLYRNYVIEQGQFTTLEQKAEANPNIRKLYGAPFIYLWGDLVVSADDINWQAFRTSLSSPVMEYFLSFAGRLEMCIRDRCWGVPPGPLPFCSPRRNPLHKILLQQHKDNECRNDGTNRTRKHNIPPRRIPVSYTHLKMFRRFFLF